MAGSGSKPRCGLMYVANTLFGVHPATEYQYFSLKYAKKEMDENSGSEQGAGDGFLLWSGPSVPATVYATSL